MLENLKSEIKLLERRKATLMVEMGKQNFDELSDLLVAEIQKRDLPPHLIKDFLDYHIRLNFLADLDKSLSSEQEFIFDVDPKEVSRKIFRNVSDLS
ncbi:MAG: hypothetical protein ACQEW4_12775 [Bacillota bacterium]|uniref:hypothetical protein n=1 Tax=Bacillus subtilis group TaxID=653685 RepID=UPI0011A538E4|nr:MULTISPECIES: hypothetical protein [Bacillus subtilis group]TWL69399.1 hypothetical protein CHCC15318_2141 [Bacillus licheniformis]TWM26924.1 hypothetical protein CHCC14821_3038 [Bacillus paralicheniformis]